MHHLSTYRPVHHALRQVELRRIAAERRAAEEEEQRFQRLAEMDPFNPEVQRRLMERVEQANVQVRAQTKVERLEGKPCEGWGGI